MNNQPVNQPINESQGQPVNENVAKPAGQTYTYQQQPASVQPNTQPPFNGSPSHSVKSKVRVPITKLDSFFTAAFLILSIIAVDFGLFGGFNLGYSIAVAAIAVSLIIYASASRRFTVLGFIYSVSAVAISSVFTVYGSSFSKFIQFFAVWGLLELALLDFTGCGAYQKGGWKSGLDLLRLAFITPIEKLGVFFGSFREHNKQKQPGGKRFSAAIGGVLCAIPVLGIILPLLISSDAAFESLVNQTSFANVPRLFAAIIFGAVLFLYMFTAIFAAAKGVAAKKKEPSAKPNFGINPMGINGFLSVISFVYLTYLFSQLSYFFGAFSGFLPKDFTVSEYARRGFFEMTVICAINLFIVGVALIFTKRYEKGEVPLSTRGLCAFISVFSLAVIATVCAKLGLYMSDLGLTKLRVYTTVFSVMLAIIFLFVIVRLFIRRFPYFRACAVFIAVLGVAVSVVDVNSYIAYYNYEAHNVGILEELDVDYLAELGDAGVPYLIKLLDNKEFAEDAAQELYYKGYSYGEIDYNYFDENSDREFKPDYNDNDFRSYNVARIKAGKLIEENWDKICDIYVSTTKI